MSTLESNKLVATTEVEEDHSTTAGLVLTEDEKVEAEEQDRLVQAAGITAATIGLLGGPIVAAVAGFESAYAAREYGNGVGDNARRLGKFGLSVQEKANEIDQQYHIVDKTSQVVGGGWNLVKKLDFTNLSEKTEDFVVDKFHKSVDYTKEHRLVERGVDTTGRGFEYIASKIVPHHTATATATVTPASA